MITGRWAFWSTSKLGRYLSVFPPKNMALLIPRLTREVRVISKQNVSSKFFQDGGVNLSIAVQWQEFNLFHLLQDL